jgi:hypothetical protein
MKDIIGNKGDEQCAQILKWWIARGERAMKTLGTDLNDLHVPLALR